MFTLDSFIDKMKDKIQTETGEKERRFLVNELKDVAFRFQSTITDMVERLNGFIEIFNTEIQKLNDFRLKITGRDIDRLSGSLRRYGTLKSKEAYAPEQYKASAEIPQRDFDQIENYISGVDWSSGEIFIQSAARTPLGMKLYNRKHNLELREKKNELVILIEEMVNELNQRIFHTELETEICKLYINNVTFISNTIRERILPELEFIDAFLEAVAVKDSVIAGRNLGKNTVDHTINLQALIHTKYEKHYLFIRNAFMFYIISSRIYSSPVLTNLLNNCVTETDQQVLLQEGTLIREQYTRVKDTSFYKYR